MTAKPIVIERQEFDSKSSLGIYYETVVRSDGLVACNCRGWTIKKEGKPRRCAHTDKVIGRRETVDDGTYTYLAKLADRVVRYRAAKEKDAETRAQQRPTVAFTPLWKPPVPPPVEPPVLSPPGRRRIVFTDE